MKEFFIAIIIFFILAGIVRYKSYKVEEDVRVFYESIQLSNLSYEESIVRARNNDLKVDVRGDSKIDGSIIMTEIYKLLFPVM